VGGDRPHGPNQVWQLDFTEFETSMGGIWRIAGIADYWSKLEFGWRVSPTQNHHDAIAAIQVALDETKRLLRRTLLETITDTETGELRPVAIVTDNGPCFKSHPFARFIDRHPELIHIRTRVKSPGQNGVRERAFRSLKYEHLYRVEIDDGHQFGIETESYRQLFNTVRPHQTLDGKRPLDVHLEARQTRPTPKLSEPETLPLS
jgi:putative transposase